MNCEQHQNVFYFVSCVLSAKFTLKGVLAVDNNAITIQNYPFL